MTSSKIVSVVVGGGILVSLFVMHRLNEQRMQKVERELRAAAEQQASLADEGLSEASRLRAAALAASIATASQRAAAPQASEQPKQTETDQGKQQRQED